MPRWTGRPAQRLRALALVAATAVLAGCASIPDAGGVHLGRSIVGSGGIDDRDIRVLPALPRPGMSPTALVRGYLQSLVYTGNDFGIARDYLAAPAAWHPSAGLTTYQVNDVSVQRTSATAVAVTVHRVGVVDGSGHYRPEPGQLRLDFGVTRASGQWRITRPPSQVLLSTYDAGRALQQATLYYLNGAGDQVVPVPVLVNVEQSGLATTLVRDLLSGSAAFAAGALSSAIPSGTVLLGNVPVDDSGVAEVDLPATVRQLPSAQLRRMSAQLNWTLRQIAGVSAVRLLAGGSPLTAPGVPSQQSVQSWATFAPAARARVPGALLVRRGVVVGALGMPTPAAFRHLRHVTDPAISADGREVAALRAGPAGQTLLVGGASGPVRPRLAAAAITPPSFDPAGDVVVAVRRDARSELVVVMRHGRLVRIPLPATLADAAVSAVRVSDDGSRIALVVGPANASALVIAMLRTAGHVTEVSDAQTVVDGSRAVVGVGWVSGSELVTTVAAGTGRDVLETTLDGYEQSRFDDTGLPAEPTQLAAAPQQPILVAAGGDVWQQSGDRWRRLSTGGLPAYPG